MSEINPDNSAVPLSTSTAPGMAEVKHKHGLLNRHDPQRNPTSNASTIVDNILTACQTGFLLGDSGLGKSPCAYQLGICASAEIPFIGEQTWQTDVLYLDFENIRAQGDEIEERICSFLGIPKTPDSFTRSRERLRRSIRQCGAIPSTTSSPIGAGRPPKARDRRPVPLLEARD